MSLREWLKHFFFRENRWAVDSLPSVPAWFNDGYIAVRMLVLAAVPFFHTPTVFITLCKWIRIEPWYFLLFLAAQLLQTTLFHLAWRRLVQKRFIWDRKTRRIRRVATDDIPVHDPTRNLFLSIAGLVELSWIFAVIYYYEFSNCFVGEARDFWDFLYFSAVTSTTLGFGDIYPSPSDCCRPIRMVVALHVFMALIMVTVVVGRAVSAAGFRRVDS